MWNRRTVEQPARSGKTPDMRYAALVLVVLGTLLVLGLRTRFKTSKNYALAAFAGLLAAAGYSVLMALNDESTFRIVFPFVSGPLFAMVIFDRIGTPTPEQQDQERQVAEILQARISSRTINVISVAIIVGMLGTLGLGFLLQYRWSELSAAARWVSGAGFAVAVAIAGGGLLYLWLQRQRARRDLKP